MSKPKEDPQWVKDGKAAAEKKAQEKIEKTQKEVEKIIEESQKK